MNDFYTQYVLWHMLLTLPVIMHGVLSNRVDYNHFEYYVIIGKSGNFECDKLGKCVCNASEDLTRVADCQSKGLTIIPEGLPIANVYEFSSNLFNTSNDDFRLSWEIFTTPLNGFITELFFDNNPLTDITKLFLGKQLASLMHLDISHCQISSLPENAFDHLNQLLTLFMSGNPIEILPVGLFRSHKKISFLFLDFCEIKKLHEDIFAPLSSLNMLDLANNKIEFLPDNIFRNQIHLQYLDLSFCEIKQLHEDMFAPLSILQWLFLSNNKIEFLPERIFKNQTSLKHLNISSNQLTSLPAGLFANVLDLKVFDASNNPFICGCGILGLFPLAFNLRLLAEQFEFGECTDPGTGTRIDNDEFVYGFDLWQCFYETTQSIESSFNYDDVTMDIPRKRQPTETQHLSDILDVKTSDSAYVTTKLQNTMANNGGILADNLGKTTVESVDNNQVTTINPNTTAYTTEGLIATGTMMAAGIVAGSVSVFILAKLVIDNKSENCI